MQNKLWITFLLSSSAINSVSAGPLPTNPSSANSTYSSSTHDRVRLFDSFFTDAVRLDSPYAEFDLDQHGFSAHNKTRFKLRGGIPITSNFDIAMSFGGINATPEKGDGETHATDFGLTGRYHFTDFKPANLSAGIRFDLPTGDSFTGGDTLEFEAFGAARYSVNEKLVATGHLGLGYVETNSFGIIAFSGPTGRAIGFKLHQ